ncbi:MAG TPA: hypothetical protein VIH93_16885 [Thermoanaerobaculia bacterium]
MSNAPHRPAFRCLLGSTLLALAACAGQPAPRTVSPIPASPPVQAAASPAPIVHLFCQPGSRSVDFAAVGVPQGEPPIAVALSPSYVWVLFQPARLLRVDRAGGSTVQMLVGDTGERWDALDVDPLDGSVWIGEEHPFSLHHVSPDLHRTTVKVRRVQGDGAFSRLLAARDALYVSAAGADQQVWRLGRDGGVLDRAFPSAHPEAAAEPRRLEVGASRLVHDGEGGVVFWDGAMRRAFARKETGWAPSAVHWFDGERDRATAVKGVGVGTKSELWYVDGWDFRSLIFWKGRPVFLGTYAMGSKGMANLLVVPAADGGPAHELFDQCGDARLADAASDATGYVGLTGRGVVIGDFATSPDLP